MIKSILLIPVIFLIGCFSVDALTGDTAETVVNTTAGGLSLLGPWGIAGGGLLTTLFAGAKGYLVHKDKKKLAMNLGADMYEKYNSMSAKDKAQMDEDVRGKLSPQYQKYYDAGKSLI